METEHLLDSLKRWGNYNTAFSDDISLQVVNEELKLADITLRCVDRRTHIEVIEVRRGRIVEGRFVPGNVLVGEYKHKDPIWQAKAIVTVLKSSSTGVEVLTALMKEFHRDEQGKLFLNRLVEMLKSENRLEELSRIIAARMMMNA